jgi:hypothetical protein
MNDIYSNRSKINRFLPGEASRRDAMAQRHMSGNPANVQCGNPLGLLRSVDNVSPIYAHPVRDASPTGCNAGCGMAFLPSEASRRDATTRQHVSGNPVKVCEDGNPLGLLRSVDNASPIYAHPVGDASLTGCDADCGVAFLPSEASRRDATTRLTRNLCRKKRLFGHLQGLHVIYFVSLNT